MHGTPVGSTGPVGSARTVPPIGGGAMGARIQRRDWSGTPLGPPSAWPAALREATRQCLAERSPAALLWGEAHLLLYNDAWARRFAPGEPDRWLGAPADEAWGQRWRDLGPLVRTAFVTRGRVSIEEHVPTTGAAERVEGVSFTPVLDPDGASLGVLCVWEDAGRRSAAAAARAGAPRRARRRPGSERERLDAVAHDLRGPLASLSSAITLMREERSAEPDQLASIWRQIQHMRRVVDDLLDDARSGGGPARRERVALRELLRDAIAASRASREGSRHLFEEEVREPQLVLEVDRGRVTRALANLLDNAARHTPPGGRIVLRGERVGDEVELSVCDTGVGLRSARLEDLIRPAGARARERTASDGLGIGLRTARDVAREHGGRLHAHSAGPGHGSRFTLRLPLPAADDRP